MKLNIFYTVGQLAPTTSMSSCLGTKKVRPNEYCKVCNAKSVDSGFPSGKRIRTTVKIAVGGAFDVELKGPPSTDLVKDLLKIVKGSSTPGKDFVTSVSLSALKEVTKEHLRYMNTRSFDAGLRSMIGKVRSMGIKVSDEGELHE